MLTIVLQSNLDCRSGGILQSERYANTEYLKWKDVDVKLLNGSKIESLVAVIIFRFEKGSKRDRDHDQGISLETYRSAQNVVRDSIMLLQAHALR